MRRRAQGQGVTLNAVAGTHAVTLGLDLDDPRRTGCLGFALQREDHAADERVWLQGTKTFAATDPGLGPGGQASTRDHPVQGFQWGDYGVEPDRDYTYRAYPLYGDPAALTEGPHATVMVHTEPEAGARHAAWFNRGSVATQEYARRFGDVRPKDLQGEARDEAYRWLSRGLLEAFVAFLERATGPEWTVRGAIYEFQWPAALAAVRAAADRGADVRVVYDGIPGATGPVKHNEQAIADAGLKDLCIPRRTGTIMHNKFVVLVHQGTPVAVWTGSTNLTENGIFGHLNVGHVVEDGGAAQAFLDYWGELATDPSRDDEVAWTAAHDPAPPDPWTSDLVTVFSPHSGQRVLDWYAAIAGGAGRAATPPLFMTFAFGMDPRFQAVYERDDGVLRFALMDQAGRTAAQRAETARIQRRPNVVVAIGNRIVTNAFDRWLAEMKGLTSNVQWVHTKFMLVDPLSDDPVVVTGSANFSQASTDHNDENMLVIRGDRRVADIYLGEFSRLYNHYAFREAVAIARDRGETSWQPEHLAPDDSWQAEHFTPGQDRYLRRRYFAGEHA